jgi:hypothetical protein
MNAYHPLVPLQVTYLDPQKSGIKTDQQDTRNAMARLTRGQSFDGQQEGKRHLYQEPLFQVSECPIT